MTQAIKSFQDLQVWQKAMEFVPVAHRLAKKLPRGETFALAGQIRRAAVSVPANIAEGHARHHTREFIQHLSIARGSLAELTTLLLIGEKLSYLTREELDEVEPIARELRMLFSGLVQSLRTRFRSVSP
jgi:four helix bundle protein